MWTPFTLLDGSSLPPIFFGTWKVPQNLCSTYVSQAIESGFDSIDTAQVYRNEDGVGSGIKASQLSRKDIWITTKWSGLKGIEESIKDSLELIGTSYVDLYLIHSPRLLKGDYITPWSTFESLKSRGLAKSIGVSNFEIADLEKLLEHAKEVPVVNQILLHPYVYERQKPLLEYMEKKGIVAEAYSALIPLTTYPGGPVDKPLAEISARTGLKPEQILLAWVRSKNAVIVTTSSKSQRLESYLAVGDVELSAEDVKAIDEAGALGPPRIAQLKETVRKAKGDRVITGIVAAVVGAGMWWMIWKA